MVDMTFECVGAQPEPYAAAPALRFCLRVTERSGARVHAVALRCQLRIEPHRRGYTATETELVSYLFGEPGRWGETLKPLQLTTVSVVLPGFSGATEVDLPVPCSYDLEVAAGKYLHALTTGEVPLLLLFSGTVFVDGGQGFQVVPLPWHCETEYRLPVAVWRELMDRYFPGSGWLRLHRDTIDRLLRYKSANAIPTWDDAVVQLVAGAEQVRS